MSEFPTMYTVFYGASSLTSLTPAQVLALDSQEQPTKRGNFVFAGVANEYLYIAIPQSLGDVDTFEVEGLDYGFVRTEANLEVVEDEDEVPYYIYRSPVKVIADEITVKELAEA